MGALYYLKDLIFRTSTYVWGLLVGEVGFTTSLTVPMPKVIR